MVRCAAGRCSACCWVGVDQADVPFYGQGAATPRILPARTSKQAVLTLVAYWYEHRDSVTVAPVGFDRAVAATSGCGYERDVRSRTQVLADMARSSARS